MNKVVSITSITTISLLLLAGCNKHDSDHATLELATVPVKTAPAVGKVHQRSQRLPGTVYPSDQAIVAARIMATIDSFDLAIGQDVSKGQLLVQLKADEIDAKVEQAQAALAQIDRNLARETSLLQQNATTAEIVRTLEDQKRLALAQLAEARTMESYKSIRAPFDGTITSKKARRGDLATPGMPLLTIDGNGPRVVHVQVPDTLSDLPRGASIKVEADGETLEAVLSEWSPAADPQSRSRLAKLALENVDVRSGQYVGVNWPAGDTRSVWIPTAAISTIGQMKRVYCFDSGVARLHLIKTGAVEDGYTQVISGITGDKILILNPESSLRDGQPVVIEK